MDGSLQNILSVCAPEGMNPADFGGPVMYASDPAANDIEISQCLTHVLVEMYPPDSSLKPLFLQTFGVSASISSISVPKHMSKQVHKTKTHNTLGQLQTTK